ncbi:3'-5' exonuclease [Octadecabacter sp. 1_MG-2023]|uniref:3'-5' exonuclease n=1 Tax=unclassified Octadecabacter TaxID=196158 RepID=UPI001C0A4D46|nr:MULTISPECIES: 3'-5' exonuclease [unclassified Octadecabacter]MBU2994415.1 3'-5' exonuclease [Octadecabacter sp. B2R22]MDO6734294.1 3'-5' exonuclease [Octadecabacter sp. 1_MG-2023]
MKHLSLRTRILLFFCLLAIGGVAIILSALWIGYRQLANPEAMSAFITAGLISGFGITGLVALIWLLFDDNVSKPIEAIAASLRVRAHVDVNTPLDVTTAKYLGDLAPAASAMGSVLENIKRSQAEMAEKELAEVRAQRDRLVEILSDVPIATFLATGNHQIILYDGQAASVMEQVGAARLKTSLFDYFEEAEILTALSQLHDTGIDRMQITTVSRNDTVYSGHIRTFGPKAGYTLMLEPLEPTAARPLTYDFDLLNAAPSDSLSNTQLRDLVYVVFDSETTGLDPVTDEVVQLGAVRVVNGKVVAGEAFETLVNPGIPIPKRSTDVHGVSNAMIADAPPFDEVCVKFHGFATGAVFVAHNAAFDMAFLHKQSPKIDRVFDQPVLDTVLMSAAVFGGSAVHTLDALCDRLGIVIPQELRHTAMGDAVATADALVAMIVILEARGIQTFGALEKEMIKHRRILKT